MVHRLRMTTREARSRPTDELSKVREWIEKGAACAE
jgi:hypothetical protein